MADLRRSLVDFTVVTDTGGVRLGPGAVVDLDMRFGAVRLRDCVDPDWFAPVEPRESAAASRRPRHDERGGGHK